MTGSVEPPTKNAGRPRAQSIARVLSLLACAAAACVTFAQFATSSDPNQQWDMTGTCIVLWNLSPFVFLACIALAAHRWWGPGSSFVVLGGALLVGAFGIYTSWWYFGPGLRLASVLIYLILPLWLWAGALVTFVLAVVLGVLHRRAARLPCP